MVKIVSFKGQFRITIPKDIVEDKGWISGTRLLFIQATDGSIVLKEIGEDNDKTR